MVSGSLTGAFSAHKQPDVTVRSPVLSSKKRAMLQQEWEQCSPRQPAKAASDKKLLPTE